MKIRQIENIDDFGRDKVFTILVGDVEKQFIDMAKKEDAENYDEGCFGIWVNYDANTDSYFVCQDEIGCELFYVNNDGDKIWMLYILTEEEVMEVLSVCKKAVEN